MILFDYPRQSYFGRTLPKAKIYAHTAASTRLKELFVRQIDQIVWKFKLAPETINIPATEIVSEIQIFAVTLKTGELHPDVLRSIDIAIPFPIVYEVSYEGKVKVMACYKRPHESGGEKWISGAWLISDWMPENAGRQALPVKLDLAALYDELLGTLIPYPPRQGESLQQRIRRAEAISRQQKELTKMEAALEKEKQFNRKVEINAGIRNTKQQIDRLKALTEE
ncbi:DUF4391 domain-containing protein [Chitinophaga solisilvae]|uniref:DUF4391 domain-containing protein n=1 Tax=Chitinophaga solisilvae TaxID=1233460 RepID=UPI00136853E2|nr:DUF4391 domain-containing protein [Chitinophaga solisilvae]